MVTVLALAVLTLPTAATAAPAGGTAVLAASTSWTTPSVGWVLGSRACATGSCTTVVRTVDAGTSWTQVGAPAARLAPSGGTGVDELHFADSRNGWAYFPQLHVTHDGGAHWSRLAIPGGGTQVVSLTTGAGLAYAVVSSCVIGNPSQCSAPAGLWKTTVGSDNWQRVPLALPEQGFPALSASGSTAYVVLAGDTSVFDATTDGVTWSPRPSPCDAAAREALQVAPVSRSAVEMLCSANVQPGTFTKRVFASVDTARTSTFRGNAPQIDSPVDFAARGATTLIAVAGGDSGIQRSGDVGRSWSMPFVEESTTLVDLTLVGSTGAVVSGPAYFPGAAGQLVLSHDSGLHWSVATLVVS